MKKIAAVWTITIILIVGCLTIFGLHFKKDNMGNIAEESLVREAKRYLGMYPAKHPEKNHELRLEGEFLKTEGFDPQLEKCEGYIIIKNESMGYTYHAYAKCPEYMTKGYSKE